MLPIAINIGTYAVVLYQRKNFVIIDKVSFNVLLSDISLTKVVVYFSNHCIANLWPGLLNIPV